jgi:hypothetical protein
VPTWFGVISGHDSAEIDGGTGQFVYAWEVFGLSFTTSRVRELSLVQPLEFQYVGSIGLSAMNGSSQQVKFFTPVRFEYEFREVTPSAPFVDHVFWKLPPGVEMNVQVYW